MSLIERIMSRILSVLTENVLFSCSSTGFSERNMHISYLTYGPYSYQARLELQKLYIFSKDVKKLYIFSKDKTMCVGCVNLIKTNCTFT